MSSLLSQAQLINNNTIGSQYFPDIAVLEDGKYVITFVDQGYIKPSGEVVSQLVYKVYNADGTEFTSGEQPILESEGGPIWTSNPMAVALSGGGFALTWEYGSGNDLYTKVFDGSGASVSPVKLVTPPGTYTAAAQDVGTVISSPDGGYLISYNTRLDWQGLGEVPGTFVQKMDAAGNRVGDPIRVDSSSYPNQPDVTYLSDGSFVVTWDTAGQGGSISDGSSNGIVATHYEPDGSIRVPNHTVNTVTGGSQIFPTVIPLSDGYVISWSDANTLTLKAQKYDINGNKVGDETTLGTNYVVDKSHEMVALPNGGFYLIARDGQQHLYGREFDANMNPLEDPVQLTTFNNPNVGQRYEMAEYNPITGEVILTYHSMLEDGSYWGVYALRIETQGGMLCYVNGTIIATDHGGVAVEALNVGDLVATMDSGYQAILWIGRTKLDSIDLMYRPHHKPIRISAGALGKQLPERDLLVSPQHRILVRSSISERMFGCKEILVAAKDLLGLNGVSIEHEVEEVEYFHILLETHQILFANGAAAESLFLGPEALKSMSPAGRAEVISLFPELNQLGYEPARSIAKKGKVSKKLAHRHKKNNRELVMLC